ncbi:tripartite tricarboxylate transporter TctB family protein [Pseudonocardia zijingensis]|jgi:putative tricarboxylic transport membrane protein|uniref:DUF1468 domain-containing protein n=1 Tax=Pseudonocardia zijingensis TaxID=153376 RepID=A0ABN1PRE1_9PSEU
MTDSSTRHPVGLDTSHGARHRLTTLRTFLPEIALLVVAAVLWLQTAWFRAGQPQDLGPAFWPRLLIVLLAVCTLARVGQKARALRSGGTDPDEPRSESDSDPGNDEPAADGRRAAIAILSIVGYVTAAIYLGYLIATAAFVVGFLLLSGRRRTVLNTALGVAAALTFSFLFLKVVYISVPSGVGIFDTFTVGVYELIGIY